MKFSVASLFAGSGLIALPILSQAYSLHVLEALTASVVAANGSVTLPETPTVWYAISGAAGLALVVIGCLVELRGMQASKGSLADSSMASH
jgi:hypothetical protein